MRQLTSQKTQIPANVPKKSLLESNQQSNQKKLTVLENNLEILNEEQLEIDAKIQSYQTNLESVDFDKLEESWSSYVEMERDLNTEEQKYTLLSTTIDSKHQTIEQISQFKHNPDCEVCIENNRSKLEKISEINSQVEELNENSSITAMQIAAIKIGMDDLREGYTFYVTANEAKNVLEKHRLDMHSCRNNIDKTENQIDQINGELEKIEYQLEELTKYEDTLVKNAEIDEKIQDQKEKLQNSKKNLIIYNKSMMNVHSILKVKESQRSNIMDQLQEISKIEQEFEAYRYYMDAVSKDGIPYQLISRTIPVIEGEINNILSQIVPFSIALDVDGKNFGGRIVYDHERSWPLENSSGMERFISSLAIRVALLKASNLPKSNFLIIDEGMGSLDSEYLHGMQLMFDLLKAQFDYVVVISHLDNIRDMVDNIIEIKKVNGYSHINTLN